MTTYCIHPIVVGTKVFDHGMMTYQYNYGKPFTIPIYSWYIEGGDQKILVDTGEMNPIQSDDREKAINGKIHTFEEGLAQWGLTPADVDIIIHTHLHNDHCENDYKCENAAVYVHQNELTRIHNPHPLDFRYLEDYIEEVEANGQIETVAQDREIVPGIEVLHTPVHTEGGLSVVINTCRGNAIITGFCVIQQNFDPPLEIKAMEMDVIPPGTLVNTYDAYDMMLKIKKRADILLPLHEPAFASVQTIPQSAARG